MAENNDDFLLDYELNNDEIPITIELALAMKADEVEKFLELYDSIPKSVESKRVSRFVSMYKRLPCKHQDAIKSIHEKSLTTQFLLPVYLFSSPFNTVP